MNAHRTVSKGSRPFDKQCRDDPELANRGGLREFDDAHQTKPDKYGVAT